MTFDPRLVPTYELGLDFTQRLWSSGPKSDVSCHNWSIILAMDIMAREISARSEAISSSESLDLC